MPESFLVLAHELRGLVIKLEVHEKADEELEEKDDVRVDTKYYQEIEGSGE